MPIFLMLDGCVHGRDDSLRGVNLRRRRRSGPLRDDCCGRSTIRRVPGFQYHAGDGGSWHMLGDKIGDETGKVTGRRVLPGDEDMRYVRIEISFEAETSVYGATGQEMGTYTIVERAPGQIYGSGQGMIITGEGEGIIWNGQGVGSAGPDGAISFAAAVTFQTSAEKFAKLNGADGRDRAQDVDDR